MIPLMILPWSLKRCGTFDPKSHRKKTSNICNSLIKGELSAIESYTLAIEGFANDSREKSLADIRADHVANEKLLREIAGRHGAKLLSSLSPRFSFANKVKGTMALLGPALVLIVLKQVEEYRLRQYEKSFNDNGLNEELKTLIRNTLLPAQRRHLIELEHCRPDYNQTMT